MIRELAIRPANNIYDKPLIAPVALPTQEEIEALALALHAKDEFFEDRCFGWDVIYKPANLLPAVFIIGDSSVWSVSYDWEDGDDQPPYVTSTDPAYEGRVEAIERLK